MITKYDKSLAIVDTEWLNKVGSAFAVAWYERECHATLRAMESVRIKTKRIEELLTDESDENGELDEHLSLLHSSYMSKLDMRLQESENRLVAVNAHEWVDGVVNELALRELGNPTLITREEFENGWQKAEAGY